MAIDHMLFNMKKWWNDSDLGLLPKKVIVKANTYLFTTPNNVRIGGFNAVKENIFTTKEVPMAVIGSAVDSTSGHSYYQIAPTKEVPLDRSNFHLANNEYIIKGSFIDVNDVLKVVRGGKHSLAYICQALRAFTARKAVSAL